MGRGETSKRKGGFAIRRGLGDTPILVRFLRGFYHFSITGRSRRSVKLERGVTVTNCRKGDHDMPPLVNLIGSAPRLPMQSLLHDLLLARFLDFSLGNGARFLNAVHRRDINGQLCERGSRDFYRPRGAEKRSRAGMNEMMRFRSKYVAK